MNQRVLLTGATGFVGAQLQPRLARTFDEVVCTTRDVGRAKKRFPERTWVAADVNQPQTIKAALDGVNIAYYLVHAMADGEGYAEREAEAAGNFVEAAHQAGVERIIYLGGVEPSGPASKHLSSRLRTGEILRAGPVPCVELRAGMIIGPGSESWCIVRDLSSRLPVMVLPRWLKSRSQPVAIDDVLDALVRAGQIPDKDVGCYSIPGPEILTATEILFRVAKLRGYRPLTISVPFISPKLSSYWIELVTRADHNLARELVEGLRSDLVATTPEFWTHLPNKTRMSFDEAAQRALQEGHADISMPALAIESLVKRFARRT